MTTETLGVSPAGVETLRYLHRVLSDADVPFLLFRNVTDRPAVAVDATFRVALGRFATGAIADGFHWAEIGLDVIGIVGRDLDVEHRIELEFWEFGSDTVTCPQPNSLTRKTFGRDDIEMDIVEFAGCLWPTPDGMFDAHAHDVGFDIDIVFSWVDGTDPKFRARRAAMLANVIVGEGDDADARIRQIDELKYALRSVHVYAPWIRRIFIATDSVLPDWLLDHPKITVVRAADHFSDPVALPTFNSHAVESRLAHIDGLAEHFLYSNDDMFFARPVRPSMFFTPGGISRFIEAGTRIGPGGNSAERSGFENAARVNRKLLREKFGHVITRHLEHTPAPLRRSVLLELEAQFPEDFARTQASRFRAATDISVTNSLYHYYALLTGRAVPQEAARMRYVDTTSYAGLRMLDGLAARSEEVDFFCLNDGSFPEVDESHRTATVSQFLAGYFPTPAPWERVVLSEPARRLHPTESTSSAGGSRFGVDENHPDVAPDLASGAA